MKDQSNEIKRLKELAGITSEEENNYLSDKELMDDIPSVKLHINDNGIMRIHLSSLYHDSSNRKVLLLKNNPVLQELVMKAIQMETQKAFRRAVHSVLGIPYGLSESEIQELRLRDIGIGAAMTAASLFGSPQQTKAQEPQQIVQQASDDIDITSSKAAKQIEKQGYKPAPGGFPIDVSIEMLQDMIGKGIKIVQGKAVGNTETAAKELAKQNAKSKASGQIIPTINITFYKTLDNKNVEVLVFLGSK
jgi:hypothetical protein